MNDDLCALAIDAARAAGHVILQHYDGPRDSIAKSDGSPLTAADRAAHHAISRKLAEAGITVVSEEADDLHLAAERYWLVDPLDGTKDFLERNGDFTVNIALVEDHFPVLGVVFAPARDELFCGAIGTGAWRERMGLRERLAPCARAPELRMAVSRFHDHAHVDDFAADNGIRVRTAIGSALKYCLLATGDVEVAPRLVGSSEWDTAAAQAVLEAAGGSMIDWQTRERLRYGKARRRNSRILACRARYQVDDFRLREYARELQ